MSVKLTNFVEININRHLANQPTGIRDTAVLLVVGTAFTGTVFEKGDAVPVGLNTYKPYVDAFFENGGRKLYITGVATIADQDAFTAIMEALPMEYCVVGIVGSSLNIGTYKGYCATYNGAVDKIFQKIFVMEAPYEAGLSLAAYKSATPNVNAFAADNFVLKYGSLGIGASVLAYYTQFSIYSADATQDYAYTVEKYVNDTTNSKYYVFDDNDFVKDILAYNMNADITLAGQVRNIGGNDTNGNDLTNQFMLLVLHQTLTERLVNTLAQKIRYNDKGIAAVINSITKELNLYVSNGFLTTNKTWTDGDLYFENYKIIDDNTMLNAGYKVTVLPYESLTPEEKAAHQLPKIYILIADSYSIRKIVIKGEVF